MFEHILCIFYREFEYNVLVGKSLVYFSEGFQLGFNIDKVLRIQEDLKDLGAVNSVADALADDFGWVDDVFKDGFVNGSQGAGSWARTLLTGGAVDGLWKNGALSNNDDVTATVQKMVNLLRIQQCNSF